MVFSLTMDILGRIWRFIRSLFFIRGNMTRDEIYMGLIAIVDQAIAGQLSPDQGLEATQNLLRFLNEKEHLYGSSLQGGYMAGATVGGDIHGWSRISSILTETLEIIPPDSRGVALAGFIKGVDAHLHVLHDNSVKFLVILREKLNALGDIDVPDFQTNPTKDNIH